MNKRIQELALEAGIVLKRPSKSWSKNPDWMKTNPNMPMEKFAELIIRECATIVENSKWNLPRDHKAIDQANLVKQHFGIEE